MNKIGQMIKKYYEQFNEHKHSSNEKSKIRKNNTNEHKQFNLTKNV